MENGKWRMENGKGKNAKPGVFVLSIIHFLLSIFLLVSPVFSEESGNDTIDVKADVIEYLEQGRLLVARGHVVATYQGTRLEASEATIQVDTKIVSCKGRAVVYQKNVTYEGDDLVYDFGRESGQAGRARIKAPPVFGGGDKIVRKETGEFEIENGYLTTCDQDQPHYKITTKHITVEPGNKVIAHNAVVWAGPIPVLFVPNYTHSIQHRRPKVSAIGGHRKAWGSFLLTAWEYDLGSNIEGHFFLDERDNLGQGYGTKAVYHSAALGEGEAKVYYTQERRRDLPEGAAAEKQRYQTSLRHSWKISGKTRTFFEYNRRSDSNVAKDYFEREYEKERNPETHWDWVRHAAAGTAEVYIRKRANRFENVTERLPQLRWHLNSLSLAGSPVYFSSDTDLTSLRKKDASAKTSNDVFRSDFINKAEMPLKIGSWLSVDPYLGMRETVYSRGIAKEEALARGAFLTGINANSRLARVYNGSIPLRHVVTPQLKYEYLSSPTVGREQLINTGDVDQLARTSRLHLNLEQKWQTRQVEENGNSTVKDLARLLVNNRYDFETERGGEFAVTSADLELRPKKGIAVDADTIYDPPSKDFLQFNLDVRLEPEKGAHWVLGHRYLQNNSVQETLEFRTMLASNWNLRVYERFNVKSYRETGAKKINEFLEQEYTLVRNLHCWEMELNYNVGSGQEFWVILRLKKFDQLPFTPLQQKSYFPSPGVES
ncbi:MAG: LPS-assembly protein LptD [Candidatus Omnitrophica bacterium]|nr:LPS-assembly protein LptD [Candidatus Omnitrophota bacterium]